MLYEGNQEVVFAAGELDEPSGPGESGRRPRKFDAVRSARRRGGGRLRREAAAGDIFARYVRLYRSIAVATHYATGAAVAVEVNDPTADYLTPTRWLNRER